MTAAAPANPTRWAVGAGAVTAGDMMRWILSAVVVVGLHGLGAATLLRWHDPVSWGESRSVMVVDLAQYAAPTDSPDDIAPGPLQQQAELPAPAPKVESQTEEKIEVPPAPVPPVAAVPPPPDVVEPPAPPVTAPVPDTTAPPPQRLASAGEIDKWHRDIVDQIQLHKAYPPAARARGQVGVVQLAFSLDRQGHVVSSRVAHASRYLALDHAAMETLEKAQPFPPPPNGLAGEAFSFTMPVEFSLRPR